MMTGIKLLEIGGEPFGIRVQLTPFGAAIFGIQVLDEEGQWVEVTVGPDSLDDFARNRACFGATCGRFANRIRDGRFVIDGKAFQLECNNGPNSLHGGSAPYHSRTWEVDKLFKDDKGNKTGVVFSMVSQDGDGGYPGTLNVKATYRISQHELSVLYEAETDAPTVLNLTNHVYWNLSGGADELIRGHELRLAADHYFPVDENGLIVPNQKDVTGSAFDFRKGAELAQGFADHHAELGMTNAYDHPVLLSERRQGAAAILGHVGSGLSVEVWSDQPALQIYTGYAISEPFLGKNGAALQAFCGVALESQNLPDAPNQKSFPSPELRPGDKYSHEISWRFDCQFQGF